jgi:hypothetical protein
MGNVGSLQLPIHLKLLLTSLQRSHFEHLDWYAGKAEIRRYLSELNRDKTVTKRTTNISPTKAVADIW